jgi:hypothetical protein
MRALRRLLICTLLGPLAFGIVLYATARVGMMVAGRTVADEWLFFCATMPPLLGILLLILLVVLTVGLLTLRAERRLAVDFRLRALWPRGDGYERIVKLACSAGDFFSGLRALIAEATQIVSVANDGTYLRSLACTIRIHWTREYLLHAVMNDAGETATIRIRPRTLGLSWLAPGAVSSAEVVAGIVMWMADQGLIERDFGPLSRPDRLERDLGKWLPARGPDGRARPLAPVESLRGREVRIPLREVLSLRVVGFGLVAMASFLALGPAGLGASRAVQAVPLLAFFVFLQAHVIRTLKNARPGPASATWRCRDDRPTPAKRGTEKDE